MKDRMRLERTIKIRHSSLVLITVLLWLCQQSVFSATESGLTFEGRLALQTNTALQLQVLRDDYQFARKDPLRMAYLPAFDFQYIQDGEFLIPVRRGAIPGAHPMRQYILEPGRISRNPAVAGSRLISLPFTLQERNANCMHNGLISLTMHTDGSLSDAEIEISSETCMYFKFNLKGSLPATYLPETVAGADQLRLEFRHHRDSRIPTATMEQLKKRYPAIDLAAFSGAGNLPPEDITVYGYVIDDVHYRGNCQTRNGTHPHCDELSLPSYSLAKTLLAGLATMRLEKLFPGSSQELIAEYVHECKASGNWRDVTFEQALNMLTGNYGSREGRTDEASRQTDDGFFFKASHADKIAFSCNAWPRQAPPGSQWVYHTTDTYILGTAINARLQRERGADSDIYRDLVLPLWEDLALGPAVAKTLRSADDVGQAFSGFGLTFLPGDIARLAVALNRGEFAEKLDSDMYESAMQRPPEPQGYYPADGKYYYRHGFWGFDARSLLGCDRPVVIPFMSGYGGINVVMMPNDSVYYTFNDGGKFAFADMLQASHRIRSMCPPLNPNNNTER